MHFPNSYSLQTDVLLAWLVPIIISFLGYKLALGKSFFDLRVFLREILHGTSAPLRPFSLEKALLSYDQYVRLSANEVSIMRASYGKLKYAHRRIGYDLGYTQKLKRLDEAIRVNGKVTKLIADLTRKELSATSSRIDGADNMLGDLSRVKESLKHFVRDWSADGEVERSRIFQPILDVLKEVNLAQRSSTTVLVPGSGLGRLAWEISELGVFRKMHDSLACTHMRAGFQTTANELSFFMNLAFRVLLSEEATQVSNQHTVQPYASWFSLQRTNEALFRSVSFPDVVPRLNEKLKLEERDFLSLLPPPPLRKDNHSPHGYDYIVTLFFIDTSLNVIETIEHLYELLRPGGLWINLGPLLWTGGQTASVELNLEEVLRLVEMVGFELNKEAPAQSVRARKSIECEYTADRTAMMAWIYTAEFWVAAKPKH